MGKYDDAIYDYFSDNERFADLFNAVIFGGRQVLRGEQLEPQPERYVTILSQRDAPMPSEETGPALTEKTSPKPTGKRGHGLPKTKSRFRDIKKRANTGEVFVMTAVEAQADIDYTMPWRIMRYDQMEYGRQIQEIRRQKSTVLQKQGKTPSEQAIRLGPEDRIRPIYTICFYHGTEIWNGPRSLRDMMEFEGTDNADIWQQYFHDYGMTLFCAGEAGDLSRFRTDLRQLLEVLAMREDSEGLEELWSREDFTQLDRDTAEIMAIMTESATILENLDKYENEEGEVNMCLAVEGMRQKWEAKGEEKGRAIGEVNIIINMYHKGYTLEQMADVANKTVEEIQNVIQSRQPVLT